MAALARAEILRPEPPPGLRAPARARRRLPGPAARRARAAARARGAACCARPAPRWTRSPASSCTRRGAATPTPRGCCTRPGWRPSPAAPSTTPSATCGARSRSRRRPSSGRGCCWTSARSRRSRAARTARRHLREAYEGLTDVAPARPRRERARPRAAVHRLAGRGRRGRAPGGARAAAGAGGRGARAGGVRADGRAVRRARPGGDARRRRVPHRPLITAGEKMMGAVAALEWTQTRRPRRRGGRAVDARARGRAAAGARPEPADARRAAADDRRRPRRGAAASSTSRWPTRTAAARCSRSPGCTCGAGSRCSGAATWSTPRSSSRVAFDQAETWGYGPDTLQWNAAHLAWCLVERGDLAGARQRAGARPGDAAATPTAPATGATRGSSCWSPRAARRTRSRPPTSTRQRFARYHNPAAARWSSLKAVALDALGHEEEGDRARRRGARPRARLGRARHGRALAARARDARGRRGDRADRAGGRGRPAARRRGWSWPSRSPRSASRAAAPAARTTRASR